MVPRWVERPYKILGTETSAVLENEYALHIGFFFFLSRLFSRSCRKMSVISSYNKLKTQLILIIHVYNEKSFT